MLFMGWLDAFRRWREAHKGKKHLSQDRLKTERQQAVEPYEPMVTSVLEQFIRSDFPDSQIQKTGAGEWEIQALTTNGDVHPHVKIQLFFDGDRPSSFLCIYFGVNRMHMRQAPLKRDALSAAIRQCILS